MNMMTGLTADQKYRSAIELVGRYPDLSKEELRELKAIYSQLSPVDMALMISNEEIAAKLDAFRREHRRALRTPFRQYAALIGILAAGLVVIVWSLAFAG